MRTPRTLRTKQVLKVFGVLIVLCSRTPNFSLRFISLKLRALAQLFHGFFIFLQGSCACVNPSLILTDGPGVRFDCIGIRIDGISAVIDHGIQFIDCSAS